ncbi:MAG: PEP-CTERM sorting domain-containing protein [Fimbriimonadaceae bacterium]
MVKGLAIVSGVALSALAFPVIVIDDFTTGTFSYTRSSVGTSSARVAGSMLGGTRWTLSNVTANPSSSQLSVAVGGGVADFVAGNGLVHVSELRYGYTLGGALADLNADLTAGGNNALKISFLENSGNLGLLVQLRRTAGASSQWFNYNTSVAASAVPFDLSIPYSVFGSFNLTDVDQVILRFTSEPGADYRLGGVEAVPEPATIAALGLGVAALMRRRKR